MPMPLSINEVLDRMDELAGSDICVRGMLSFEFENVSLTHLPRAERRENEMSSIWLSTGNGALSFNQDVCKRLNGKVVVVEGTLVKPEQSLGGCGHMSFWPAELVIRTLARE